MVAARLVLFVLLDGFAPVSEIRSSRSRAVKETLMTPRNVIIDCDTGVDDAEALLLALRSPEFNVLGITTVGGNVSIEKVVRNTLVVVEHSGNCPPAGRAGSSPPACNPRAAWRRGLAS